MTGDKPKDRPGQGRESGLLQTVSGLIARARGTKFLRDAGTMTGAQFLVAILAFVQGIIVAAWLGPEQYGIALLIISVPRMLFSVLDAKTSAAAVKFISEFKAEGAADRARAMCKLGYLVDMVIAGLTFGLVAVTASWAENNVAHWSGAATLMIWYSAAFLPKSLVGTSQALLSVNGNFKSMAVLQIIAKLVGVVAVLALVLSGWGVAGVIYGRMIEMVFAGISLAILAGLVARDIWNGSWLRARISSLRGYRRDIFRFIGFTELTELAGVLGKQGDVIILGYFSGAEQVGFFGLAKRLTGAVSMLVQPLQTVLYPRLAKAWANREYVSLRRTIKRFALGISVPLAVLVLLSLPLVGPFIRLLVGSEFEPAVPVAYIILIAAAATLACSWLRTLFHAMGAVRFLLINSTIVNVFSVIAYIFASQAGDAMGVAWVHLVSAVLFYGAGLTYARHRLRNV
jgi:O-antigen/teichoic acid export membrane protein